jgi:hypothetical protein
LRQNYLFLTTDDPNDGLQIWDVSGSPVRHDTTPLNIQQGAAAGSDCYGNLLYIAQRSNRAMQVIGPFVPFGYSLSSGGDISIEQGKTGTNTVTATLTSGVTQNIGYSVALPAALNGKVTPSFAPGSCKPNCSTTLALVVDVTAPLGTYPITVNSSGGKSAIFNLTVTQGFQYTLGASPATLVFTRTSPGTETITVTKTAGTAAPVTLSFSNIPNNVSVAPITGTCTPSSGSCQLNFTVSISSGAHRTGTITVTGAPNGTATTFDVAAN